MRRFPGLDRQDFAEMRSLVSLIGGKEGDWGGSPINKVALWGPTYIVYRLLFHRFLASLPKYHVILALVV